MKITDKNIKKNIVRKNILQNYIELCMNTGYEFTSVLGVSLQALNYNIILDRMDSMNDRDKYTFVPKERILWFDKMIKLRSL
tara:strand:+ start:608 stop:853 length:246 start_codon:yes stop_codon:yes gene_type:complete